MSEIITCHLGESACEIGTKFWNEYLVGENFKENQNQRRLMENEKSPRVIFIDQKTNFVNNSDTTQVNKNDCLPDVELFDPNTFGGSSSLSNTTWSSRIKFNLEHHNIVQIKENIQSKLDCPIYSKLCDILYCEEILHDTSICEDYVEALRVNMEKCDLPNGLQLIVDMNSSYAFILSDIMSLFYDEYPHKSVFGNFIEATREYNFKHLQKNHINVNALNEIFGSHACHSNVGSVCLPIDSHDSASSIMKVFNYLWLQDDKLKISHLIDTLTDISYGSCGRGIVGCALHEIIDYDMTEFIKRIMFQTKGFNQNENLFRLAHQQISYENIFSQIFVMDNAKNTTLADIAPFIKDIAWKEALNFHIPQNKVGIRDLMDTFLSFNYYGARNTIKTINSDLKLNKSQFLTIYNGKTVYDYLSSRYNESKDLLHLCKRLYPSYVNRISSLSRDNIDELYSNLTLYMKDLDPDRAFEDFSD